MKQRVRIDTPLGIYYTAYNEREKENILCDFFEKMFSCSKIDYFHFILEDGSNFYINNDMIGKCCFIIETSKE